MIQPSDYCPLLVVQVGSEKVDERSLSIIKKNFRARGQLVEGTGAQGAFSSSPSVARKNGEKNRRTCMINVRLRDWCHWWNLGFFHDRGIYITSDLIEADGIHLFKRRKNTLALELTGLIERALN